MTRFSSLAVALAAAAAVGCAGAHAQPQAPSPKNGGAKASKEAAIKPYRDVIPDSARVDSGLFQVDQFAGKLYYEVPTAMLGKEMLLVTRIARTQNGIGYGGEEANEMVVRWTRQNDKILLRVRSYDNVASDSLPIHQAVVNANFEPIIAAFDIEAMTPDSSAAVINVTPLFLKDVPALGLPKYRRDQYKVRSLDDDRSYLVYAHSYPRNIEVHHVLTYTAADAPADASTESISLEMAQSMVLLPDVPMKRRLWDERVGFFSVQQTDYGRDAEKAEVRRYITRWRLEPKDTAAFRRGELVEPVKPIVYYIDPATPKEWRPFLKQGIDDWQKAFEAAGFKNAIIAKDPPTPQEDPEFSLEDVRYSVVRWFPSDVENAYGPHISDPRTGEILNADIGFYHNVMSLVRDWFFIQTAAANPAARHVKYPTELMGTLLRFVVSHEIGHTLGLPHDMKASASYPVDSLRTDFSCRMGTAPSIMDYARFNYVAQPGDKGVCFMPGIGPYDLYSINWGYRPILDAQTPDDERPTLDKWVRAHEGDPVYQFGDPSGIDPTSQTEALGDDGVKASEYGIANLKRIVPHLIEWTHTDLTDYSDLQELYDEAINQWNRYMGHVATIVGGVVRTRKTDDEPGPVYVPVSKRDQERAMRFFAEQAFTPPTWMLDDSILTRIGNPSSVDAMRGLQVGVLNRLLDPRRLQRLSEITAWDGTSNSYTLGDFFADLRSGVWGNLASGAAIDVYRRNLQRGWIDQMASLMTEEPTPIPARFRAFIEATDVNVSQSDIRPYVRGELEGVKAEIARALPRVSDPATKLHLQDASVRIERILNPNK